MGKMSKNTDELSEDFCFTCKDGGHLRVCDFKNCLKAYHPHCVGKEASFLDSESDEIWNCGWHSCVLCKKPSYFQCYCCPSSVCRECIAEAEFVQIRKKNMGFCTHCLRLALLIEDNIDIDSEGAKVDFEDTETYEFLFKDYWEIVKYSENLSLADLHSAHNILKGGEQYKDGEYLENEGLDEKISGSDYMLEDQEESGHSFLSDLNLKKQKRKAKTKTEMKTKIPKKWRANKKKYIGWGSEELIGFLSYLGKDTNLPVSQLDASEIIKSYVQSNNLYQPDKKKKVVLCDERLRVLFRKKKVKFHRIYSLLESHFRSNGDSGDETELSLDLGEEEREEVERKKKARKMSPVRAFNAREYELEQKRRSSPASLERENLKLVYLRRSLIVDLLKNSDAFEKKVIGCFVRVKHDPRDFYATPKTLYQLSQITGINKDSEMYKIGDFSTDIVFRVSNIWKDVNISMLADDDFAEDELEDLCALAKKDLFKMPTVAEFEEKVRMVHEDITSHWINRELIRLQRLINQANDKGWRRELFEYINKRDLLKSPEERERLMKEIPLVIAERGEDEEREEQEEEQNKREKTTLVHNFPLKVTKNGSVGGTGAVMQDRMEIDEVGSPPRVNEFVMNKEVANNGLNTITFKDTAPIEPEVREPDSSVNYSTQHTENTPKQNTKNSPKNTQNAPKATPVIIDLIDDDDDGDLDNKNKKNEKNERKDENDGNTLPATQIVWHYADPQGGVQGPFPMSMLRKWRDSGFFDDDFKVWKTGQSRDCAILLTDALRLVTF